MSKEQAHAVEGGMGAHDFDATDPSVPGELAGQAPDAVEQEAQRGSELFPPPGNRELSKGQGDFTSEKVAPEDKADYYDRLIRKSWTKSTEGIMETASLCAMAQKALPARELEALQSRLPFDPSTFSKLAKIGRDDRFRSPQVKDLLPSKFSLLYEMTKLADGDFQRLFREGKITPRLKRADLERLLPPPKSGGGKKKRVVGGAGGGPVLPALPIEALQSMSSEALADWIRPVHRLLAERGHQGLLEG